MEAPSDYLSTHKNVDQDNLNKSKRKRRIRSKLREKGELNLNRRSGDTQKFLAKITRSERRAVGWKVG